MGSAGFEAWLALPEQPRELLLVLSSLSGVTWTYYYYSTHGRNSGPVDSPAHTHYEPRIVGNPYAERSVDRWGGRERTTHSVIDLSNADGGLDWMVQDHGLTGREVPIYLGSPDWSFPSFELMTIQVLDRLEFTADNVVRLHFKDRASQLDKLISESTFATGPATGKPLPIAYGRVRNVTPVLYDSANLIYQVSDADISAVEAVYDNAYELTLSADACATGGYTVDAANAQFTLCNSPAGQITATVKGNVDGGSAWLETPGEIARYLIETYSTLTSSELDTASFAQIDTDWPYTVGLYWTGQRNLLDVLDQIAINCHAVWGTDRDGKIYMRELMDGSASVLTIGTDQNISGVHIEQFPPVTRMDALYQRNWTVQQDNVGTYQTYGGELASGITDTWREWIGSEWRAHQSAAIVLPAPSSADKETRRQMETIWDTEAHASAAIDTITIKHFNADIVATLTCALAPGQVELGDKVTVETEQWGWDAGKDMYVIGIREEYLTNRLTLTLWV